MYSKLLCAGLSRKDSQVGSDGLSSFWIFHFCCRKSFHGWEVEELVNRDCTIRAATLRELYFDPLCPDSWANFLYLEIWPLYLARSSVSSRIRNLNSMKLFFFFGFCCVTLLFGLFAKSQWTIHGSKRVEKAHRAWGARIKRSRFTISTDGNYKKDLNFLWAAAK